MNALSRRLTPAIEEEVAAELAPVAAPKPATPPKAQTYEELGQKPPCFLAGTLIKTPLGDRPIEKLATEDEVFAYDFETAQVIV